MLSIIRKYRLNIGLPVSLLIGIAATFSRFIGSEDGGEGESLSIELQELLIISGVSFCFWCINFALLDFKSPGKRKTFKNIPNAVLIVLSFVAGIALTMLIVLLLLNFFHGHNYYKHHFQTFSRLFEKGLVRILVVNSLVILLKYMFDLGEEKQQVLLENQVLKNENIKVQFEALKQQVNPHFLFNSLTSLKSLIKTDSARSTDFVVRLSQVYRYLLQHRESQTVLVKEELEFLHAYIFLLESRFEKNLIVRIDLPLDCLNTYIPPISLQMLLENAVKHNIVSASKPLLINIRATDGFIVVENVFQPRVSVDESGNFGLKSIGNRYQLLVKKDIVVTNEKGMFSVSLPIIYHP